LRQKVAPIGALLLLCLIWAAASLRSDLLPGTAAAMHVTPLESEAMLLAIFAVLAGVAALTRKARWPRGRALAMAGLVGLGLFVVPALLTDLGKGWIDDFTRVALFSLTPVFAVVFEPHLGTVFGNTVWGAGERGGFPAALMAVVGTLLVFPVEIPHSAASALAFCGALASAASVAAANCLGVRACRESSGSLLTFGAVAAGCAALCLGSLGAVLRKGEASAVPFDAWAAPDLFALALLFWLMGRMTAVRMTTRFVIAPLLANLVGLALLRPQVQLQAWFGLLLIALGSGWLLVAPRDNPETSGSPLGLH